MSANPVRKSSSVRQPLQGQTAVVTGAGARVGRAIAIALADAGATVAVHYNASAADANRAPHDPCTCDNGKYQPLG